jgi:CHAT domain-containing protein/tetratricopeptide (TPR) repeat protein
VGHLGAVYYQLQEFEKAEPLLQQALALHEQAFGQDHPRTCTARGNLAVMYSDMSDFLRAEPLLRSNVAIQRKHLAENHPDTALSQLKLARLLTRTGKYDEARTLLNQSLIAVRDRLGAEHEMTVLCLEAMSIVDTKTKRFGPAEDQLQEALAIRRKQFGARAPSVGTALNQLGYLYIAMGKPTQAQQALEMALDIAQSTNDPDAGLSVRHNLAVVKEMLGDFAAAQAIFFQNADETLRSIERQFARQSERQKIATLQYSRCHFDAWVRIAANGGVSAKDVYDRVLKWKGIVLADAARSHLMRTKPGLAQDFAELERLGRELAALSLNGSSETELAGSRESRIEELTRRKEDVERSLDRQSAEFRVAEQLPKVDSDDLAALLPQGAALVDFLALLDYPIIDGRSTTVQDRHLVAFVVRPDGAVTRVDYGPIEPIRTLIDKWLQGRRLTPGQRQRGADAPDDTPVADELAEAANKLRSLLWDPIEESLGGADTVLISPDGPLCRLPFAALPGSMSDKYLIEERAVAVVPAPQLLPQLVVEMDEPPQMAAAHSLLLVGDVDYGADPGGETLAGESSTLADFVERTSSLNSYAPLPQTRAEIDRLRETFAAEFTDGSLKVLSGRAATEAAFRQIAPQQRWLHLATHGFFARPSPAEMNGGNGDDFSLFGRQGVASFHPGLRSGVVLTGANAQHSSGQDDGILTALEVEALDLNSVDLAVLSACETGLGEEAGGEGLLGLQRAFQIAGARTVVSSLWTVPDEPTSLLMQRFYDNLWRRRMPKIEALREAQIWMLSGGSTAERADVPPANWAAFVLTGDWQ